VTTAALRDRAVTTRKLADKEVTLAKLAPSARIPGPKGDPGPQGDAGRPGMSGYEVVTAKSLENALDAKIQDAVCPAGKKAVGGGALISGGPVLLQFSVPSVTGNAWIAKAYEEVPYASPWYLETYAVCVNVAP
jgi:hypothetical protein